MAEISFLLGAGFSVNKGYPTANQLNRKITELSENQFTVAQEGSVCWLKPGEKDPFVYTSYHTQKLFTIELIAFFVSISGGFNYEEFFDFYINVNNPNHRDERFENFCDEFRAKYNLEDDNHNLIRAHNSIFNQLVSALLVDGEGTKFYPKIHHGGPYPGYNGFLGCLQYWGRDNVLNLHTLNHDLFLESLNHTDAMHGDLSTGFTELGSPYYGQLDDYGKVRLSHFTGNYNTNYRLYKLHGSLDQYPFHGKDGQIEGYVKNKKGIGVTDFYKEVIDDNGELKYVNDFVNYFPDFLTGTTSKILRYQDPVYYETIFKLFEENLQTSKKLILIGYGCGDSEINNIILNNFRGEVYAVDPFPNPKTFEFCERTGAVIIEKTPENIGITDFQQ
ncbi:hypothetical protein [Pedobacter nanyangensis]|uniref:hypothetical protein n=1 Tax=Pedobacter nanyangensis TaxID=1562389 RepID=UPI000DE467F2|nr:hypothetical protein [Pedobacter nanyangensis]